MGDSDCSETEANEGVPLTASPAPLQPPSPKTPPTNGAGFKSPVGVTGVTEVKDKAAAEVKQAPAVGTSEPLSSSRTRTRETQTEEFRQMRAVQLRVHRLGMVTGGMGGRKNVHL